MQVACLKLMGCYHDHKAILKQSAVGMAQSYATDVAAPFLSGRLRFPVLLILASQKGFMPQARLY